MNKTPLEWAMKQDSRPGQVYQKFVDQQKAYIDAREKLQGKSGFRTMLGAGLVGLIAVFGLKPSQPMSEERISQVLKKAQELCDAGADAKFSACKKVVVQWLTLENILPWSVPMMLAIFALMVFVGKAYYGARALEPIDLGALGSARRFWDRVGLAELEPRKYSESEMSFRFYLELRRLEQSIGGGPRISRIAYGAIMVSLFLLYIGMALLTIREVWPQ